MDWVLYGWTARQIPSTLNFSVRFALIICAKISSSWGNSLIFLVLNSVFNFIVSAFISMPRLRTLFGVFPGLYLNNPKSRLMILLSPPAPTSGCKDVVVLPPCLSFTAVVTEFLVFRSFPFRVMVAWDSVLLLSLLCLIIALTMLIGFLFLNQLSNLEESWLSNGRVSCAHSWPNVLWQCLVQTLLFTLQAVEKSKTVVYTDKRICNFERGCSHGVFRLFNWGRLLR